MSSFGFQVLGLVGSKVLGFLQISEIGTIHQVSCLFHSRIKKVETHGEVGFLLPCDRIGQNVLQGSCQNSPDQEEPLNSCHSVASTNFLSIPFISALGSAILVSLFGNCPIRSDICTSDRILSTVSGVNSRTLDKKNLITRFCPSLSTVSPSMVDDC